MANYRAVMLQASPHHLSCRSDDMTPVRKRRLKNEPLPSVAVTDSVQHSFLNRELGVLAFNERVFAQAEHGDVPLLERLRFLCITSSNLDEFFEIRVAGLKEQILQNPALCDADGLSVLETYELVSERAHQLVARQYDLLNQTLLPQLEQHGVHLHLVNRWTEAITTWARLYFESEILPVLTPIGLDPAHPFPRVLNKSLNFAVELGGRDAFGRNSGIAIVQAPRALPRLIRLPSHLSSYPYSFVMLTSVMQAFVGQLFPGMELRACHQFRVTRNSDLFVDDEEITNLRVALQGELPQRHFGDAVRLEISESCTDAIATLLMHEFKLEPRDVYRVGGPVNLVRLMQVCDSVDLPELKFKVFTPGLPMAIQKAALKNNDLFRVISKHDVLLHHPYQSFNPVLDFLRTAAADPQVVAIKQTIYRTGTDSALMDALLQAAKSGKEVTVVVELMARFDEETNINWAARLEQVGAHVVYGVVGTQDARQDGSGREARDRQERGAPPAPLCAPGDRQLSPPYRAPVYRLRPVHGTRGHLRRRAPRVPATDRPRTRETAQVSVAGTLRPAPGHPRRHRA